MGVAVLILSAWLMDQRDTDSRAQTEPGEQTSVGGRNTRGE